MRFHEALAGVLMVGTAVVVASAASAATRTCKKCSSLPYLKRELDEQEFLENAFREYWKNPDLKPPTRCQGESAKDAMVSAVTAADQAFLDGPAGGGRRAINVHPPCGNSNDEGQQQIPCKPGHDTAGGAFETGTDCKTVIDVPSCVPDAKGKGSHIEVKQLPIDSDEGKKEADKRFCDVDQDFLLAHEKHHRDSCNSQHPPDLGQAGAYAMDDAKAYLDGIRNLRQQMHDLAKDCGWNPSHDQKFAQDGDPEFTVPTTKQAKSLSKALGGKK